MDVQQQIHPPRTGTSQSHQGGLINFTTKHLSQILLLIKHKKGLVRAEASFFLSLFKKAFKHHKHYKLIIASYSISSYVIDILLKI